MTKILTLAIVAGAVFGCGQKQVASGPSQGTLGLESMTPEERIKKVQEDPQIPEQYKQTYINSQKAQAGQR